MKRLVVVALSTAICIAAHAQTQGNLLVDVGAGAGTKHALGYLLGVRYFVRDGWSVDIYGSISMGALGFGLETSYFPKFANGWLYVDTGLSMLFLLQRETKAMTVISLNGDVGSNSPRFKGETERGAEALYAVYGELGISRVLFNSKDRGTDGATPNSMSSGSWWFPNIELGLRTGQWSW